MEKYNKLKEWLNSKKQHMLTILLVSLFVAAWFGMHYYPLIGLTIVGILAIVALGTFIVICAWHTSGFFLNK